MTVGSFRGRPGHHPVKKLCKKCGKRSGNQAISGKELCKSCITLSPETRNSAQAKHPRQH